MNTPIFIQDELIPATSGSSGIHSSRRHDLNLVYGPVSGKLEGVSADLSLSCVTRRSLSVYVPLLFRPKLRRCRLRNPGSVNNGAAKKVAQGRKCRNAEDTGVFPACRICVFYSRDHC